MLRRLFGFRRREPAVSTAPEAAIVAAAADGILATDPDGRITLANRAALALTGFGERELLGTPLHGLLHPACEDPACPVDAAARDGKPRTFVTETLRRRGDDQAAAEVALSCLRDGGLVAIVRDVTERRRAEAELRGLLERAVAVPVPEAPPAVPVEEPTPAEAAPPSVEEPAPAVPAEADAASVEEPAPAVPEEVASLIAERAPAAREAAAAPVHAPTPAVDAPVHAGTPTREIAVVRQPITDADGAAVGYELLVGGGSAARRPLGAAAMTAAMLLDAFGDVGIERLAGRHPAWVPITPAFLLEVGTPPVRPDRVVLQLPAEPVAADALGALRRLRWSGYSLALNGYDGRAELGELLDVAAFVKVSVAGQTDAELREAIREPARRGLELVATRVEAPEEVERCRALGFSLFQGSFFAKPNLVRQRRVGTGGVQSLRTLARVAVPDASFEDLEKAISADVGLSLKLLRYVNSAFFSLPRTVGSVHEALTLLGMATVRRWATVMALADATAEAPEELVELALQRARMCEVLGGEPDSERADALFTVGLFSVADALLGTPMEEVLETLPFSEEIRAALLRHEGDKGELLQTVKAYERGDFPDAPQAVRAAGVSVPDAYVDAVDWAGEARHAVP